jgi:hypothetical protein
MAAPLQELGDATMLSNGNIVFCRKVGASEITPDKKIIWNIDAPRERKFIPSSPSAWTMCSSRKTAIRRKLMLINTVTGATEKEFTFPVLNPEQAAHPIPPGA